jgi:hypothetical protein
VEAFLELMPRSQHGHQCTRPYTIENHVARRPERNEELTEGSVALLERDAPYPRKAPKDLDGVTNDWNRGASTIRRILDEKFRQPRRSLSAFLANRIR